MDLFFTDGRLQLNNPIAVAVLVLALAVLFWTVPEFGLAIFVAAWRSLMNILITLPGLGSPISIEALFGLFLLGRCLLLYRGSRAERRIWKDPLAGLCILIFALDALGCVRSMGTTGDRYTVHVFYVINVAVRRALPFLCVLAMSHDVTRIARHLRFLFAILLILQLLFVAALVEGGRNAQRLFELRGISVFGMPIWGSGLELYIPLALSYILCGRPRTSFVKWIASAGMMVAYAMLVVAQTRVLWIAVPISVLFVVAVAGRRRVRVLTSGVPVAIGIIIVALAFARNARTTWEQLDETAVFRYVTSVSDKDLATASSGRVEIWQHAWPVFLKHPVLGAGVLGASPDWTVTRSEGTSVMRPGIHNYYLEILTELGIVGFLVFGGIVIRLAKVVRANFRISADSMVLYQLHVLSVGVITVHLVVALTSTNMNQAYWAMGLALVTYHLSRLGSLPCGPLRTFGVGAQNLKTLGRSRAN